MNSTVYILTMSGFSKAAARYDLYDEFFLESAAGRLGSCENLTSQDLVHELWAQMV